MAGASLEPAGWYSLIGLVFVLMAFAATRISKLPLSSAVLYLGLGSLLGSVGLLRIPATSAAPTIEVLTEIAVAISLFSVGLKLRVPWRDSRWLAPLRLAFLSMTITVFGIAAVGVYLLGLSWGASIVLGAILAPTDPVLASDVQVDRPGDTELLRFTLTGEGGLNDGTAFPFMMLGLGLLGLNETHHSLGRWLTVDVCWRAIGGLGIGALLGGLVGRFCLFLRHRHHEAVGSDNLLALGLVAISYGSAVLLGTYGFLAVFAAGSALRRIELETAADESPRDPVADLRLSEREAAVDPDHASAFMTRAVLAFNEQLEKISEVFIVILVGALLPRVTFDWRYVALAAVLFLVIRPISIFVGTSFSRLTGIQRGYAAWFGIRGIGSIYYVAFALAQGVIGETGQKILDATLVVVAASILVHGVTVTPLMERYQRYLSRQRSNYRRVPRLARVGRSHSSEASR